MARNNCGGFYKVKVETVNPKGKKDVIPVVLSEVFIADINKPIQNKYIKVKGKYRSFTKENEEGQKHLEVFVLASDITFLEKELYENKIYFDGYLCEYGAKKVYLCSRTLAHAKELLAVHENLTVVDYHERYDAMKRCETVIR